MGNWCWSRYNVCMLPELDSSRKCCIFFRARKTRYRKWEKEKHSRGCLISFSPPATRDQVGWLLWGELVGFCITWPWVEEYIVYRLVYVIHKFHVDISLQCNDYQGESFESCGKPSEWSNFLLKKYFAFLNQICQGEAAMLATKRVVAPMRAALGNININTRFEFTCEDILMQLQWLPVSYIRISRKGSQNEQTSKDILKPANLVPRWSNPIIPR